MKHPRHILQSERHSSKVEKNIMGCKGGFIPIFFSNFDLPISAFSVQCWKYRGIAQRIETFFHAWYWYESQNLTAFNLPESTQKRIIPSFLGTNTIGVTHFVCTGLKMSMASIRFISWLFNSIPLSPVRYGSEIVGQLSVISSSVWCGTVLIQPMVPSHMLLNCVAPLMILSLYAEYSLLE